MSVPIPRGAHLKPMEAPSPPEEPPGVRVRLCGLRVVPVILLLQQRCYVVSASDDSTMLDATYHEGLGLIRADVEDCAGLG